MLAHVKLRGRSSSSEALSAVRGDIECNPQTHGEDICKPLPYEACWRLDVGVEPLARYQGYMIIGGLRGEREEMS